MFKLGLVSMTLFGLIAQAAYATVSYTKFWGLATYYGRYEQLLYTIEPQIRLATIPGVYDQTLLNTGIGKTVIPQLQLWLGQTYVNYSVNNDVEDVSLVTANEYRIWEQMMWRKPFIDQFASRLRLEQRRAFQNNKWAVRLRERAYWTFPINDSISIALNNEFFLNLNNVPWIDTSIFDQNRFFGGIYYKISSKIGVNISYMNQFIPRVPFEVNHGLVLNLIANMT